MTRNHRNGHVEASGFTIVEVMIALAASLLLMLGLTRAYKLIGDRITESQSRLELSSTLRDVAFRLRDELRRATSEMTPPGRTSRGDGYLVYYEGPFSGATTTLGDGPPVPPKVSEPMPDYYPTSRFGDIDDYLAFTARADEGSPFVGFIPRGILEANRYKRLRLENPNLTLAQVNTLFLSTAEGGTYTTQDGVERVPFYANQAEIAYWLSPRWSRTANGDIDFDPDTGHPLYPDKNADQLPDRLDLHRRVLLIRPDLNMKPSEMGDLTGWNAGASPEANIPQLPFLYVVAGNLRILPMTPSTGNQPFFDGVTPLVAPGNWFINDNTFAPHWLCGVARAQQVMDLSISRVTNNVDAPYDPVNGTGSPTSVYGMPTPILEANSLAGLSRPENRFAHVRMPERLVSGAPTGIASTMPQLALSPPHPYLTLRPSIFPLQGDHNVGTPPGIAAKPQFGWGRFTLVGFVRPEYNLADTVTDAGAGGNNRVGVNRGGTDVVASDLLGFDIQIYDPAAPQFVWVGPDGTPGTNVDDDQNGVNGDNNELGFPESDDEVVELTQLRSREVLWDANSQTNSVFRLVDRGSFVDLNYTRSAGGSMRGFIDGGGGGAVPPGYRGAELIGPYSGLELPFSFPVSWERSGRFVISRGSGTSTVSSFYQPVFDTWTDSYGRDEYDQEGRSTPLPPSFPYGAVPVQYEERFSGGGPAARVVQYRQWSNHPGESTATDFAGLDAGNTVGALAGSTSPIESTAPITDRLRALKVTIRIFDQSAAQIRQQTLIQDF